MPAPDRQPRNKGQSRGARNAASRSPARPPSVSTSSVGGAHDGVVASSQAAAVSRPAGKQQAHAGATRSTAMKPGARSAAPDSASTSRGTSRLSPRGMLPGHFSMLREFHLADFFTLGNAACGVGSVFLAMLFMASNDVSHFLWSAALAPAALVFDVLDGRVARWRQQHSSLGRELDSLADIVSFGIAPAALAFAAGLRGGWDVAALIYFVCCGVSRLARFNVSAETLSAGTDKVKYFEGTPIPTTVALTAVLAAAAWNASLGPAIWGGQWIVGPWAFHPLGLLFVLSGTLMISKTLHVPKW